jgi:hypothetical protein
MLVCRFRSENDTLAGERRCVCYGMNVVEHVSNLLCAIVRELTALG